MDPTIALETALDTDADREERSACAEGLIGWLQDGGFMPDSLPESERRPLMARLRPIVALGTP